MSQIILKIKLNFLKIEWISLSFWNLIPTPPNIFHWHIYKHIIEPLTDNVASRHRVYVRPKIKIQTEIFYYLSYEILPCFGPRRLKPSGLLLPLMQTLRKLSFHHYTVLSVIVIAHMTDSVRRFSPLLPLARIRIICSVRGNFFSPAATLALSLS